MKMYDRHFCQLGMLLDSHWRYKWNNCNIFKFSHIFFISPRITKSNATFGRSIHWFSTVTDLPSSPFAKSSFLITLFNCLDNWHVG